MMFVLNGSLALVSLVIAAPDCRADALAVASARAQGFREQQRHLGELNGMIEETITGQRVVKAYGREAEADRGSSSEANRELRTRRHPRPDLRRPGRAADELGQQPRPHHRGRRRRLAGGAGPGHRGRHRQLSSAMRERFTWPLNQLAQLYNTIQSALAGAERVFELLDEAPDLVDAPDARAAGTHPGRGRLRGRVFRLRAGACPCSSRSACTPSRAR